MAQNWHETKHDWHKKKPWKRSIFDFFKIWFTVSRNNIIIYLRLNFSNLLFIKVGYKLVKSQILGLICLSKLLHNLNTKAIKIRQSNLTIYKHYHSYHSKTTTHSNRTAACHIYQELLKKYLYQGKSIFLSYLFLRTFGPFRGNARRSSKKAFFSFIRHFGSNRWH